jgi:hypothetical protein
MVSPEPTTIAVFVLTEGSLYEMSIATRVHVRCFVHHL